MKQRKYFSSSTPGMAYPDLLDIQVQSFQSLFDFNGSGDKKMAGGLARAFQSFFPISDSKDQYRLEFVDCSIAPPQHSVRECVVRGLTYSVALKAKLRLLVAKDDSEEYDAIEQTVFLGSIPYMLPQGSFIINGAERVIVSQLHRSPGVFFSQSKHAGGARLYSARVIPFKGSWIEFVTDVNNVMFAYIDRRKKFPVTMLLRAVGYGLDKDILGKFGICEEVKVQKKLWASYVGRKLAARVLHSSVEDFVDEDSGEVISIPRHEVILERGTVLKEEDYDKVVSAGADTLILHDNKVNTSEYAVIFNTLQKDTSNSEKEALQQIYRHLRNVEAPDETTAREAIQSLFFSERRYDLGEVGRYKINRKLGLDISSQVRVLTPEDIFRIVEHLIKMVNGKASVDDIDHLSNRRVRTVGELLFMQFSQGLSRMARIIRDRMNVRDNEDFKPVDLLNARTLSSVINSFFGTHQLSQFMDQTNPLAELTHKRRVSALGPGGLSRERASFEVRDVHYTHYGRLCTIETPEGPNIGLISSLCVYAKVNDMGFIETPYRKVKSGMVKKDICYLSAEEENGYIAQANAPLNKEGGFVRDIVKTRLLGDFPLVPPSEVQYMDAGSNQIMSVAASLIPFLEHNDANRALMGSNMQRQAVPLLCPSPPIVGTGMEREVAKGGRNLFQAEGSGEVVYVDANEIHVRYDMSKDEKYAAFDEDVVRYDLTKFRRTNQDTCMNLSPIVRKGQRVVRGEVLCDGYGTCEGELALGANLMVAFMPWRGYNFEDAILISERVVNKDIFTSIHIEVFELDYTGCKAWSGGIYE